MAGIDIVLDCQKLPAMHIRGWTDYLKPGYRRVDCLLPPDSDAI